MNTKLFSYSLVGNFKLTVSLINVVLLIGLRCGKFVLHFNAQ